jgi:hypothetical protein
MNRQRSNTLGGLFLALMLLSACGGEAGDAPPAEQDAPPPASQPAATPPPPEPAARATAPANYRVRFETSKGDFVVEIDRSLAPNGADRFYQLVSENFFDEVRFFRVISGFMAQFGINGDPTVTARWRARSRFRTTPWWAATRAARSRSR